MSDEKFQDIPKIDDKDFSVTLNAFFVVRWTDTRLVIDQARIDEILGPEAELADEPEWIPVSQKLQTLQEIINIFPTTTG